MLVRREHFFLYWVFFFYGIFSLALLGQLQDFVMSISTVLDRHFFVHRSFRFCLLSFKVF